MDVTKELTIVIPLRIDSKEREENVNTVVRHLLDNTCVQIILLEADNNQKYHPLIHPNVTYHFLQDNNETFFRTRYINKLLTLASTPIVGVWDSDVLLPVSQIHAAIHKIKEGNTLCIPYGGKCIGLNGNESNLVRLHPEKLVTFENKSGSYSVGGAFIVNKEDYLIAGGENEVFDGWGPEDIERIKRLEILEYKTCRIPGNLYHLHHPTGKNSYYKNEEKERYYLQVLLGICRKNKQELLEDIKQWKL